MVTSRENNICEKCGGTGWILDRKKNTVRRCGCAKTADKEYRLTKAGIPKRYSDCTLENFDAMENRTFNKALKESTNFVKRYPAVKKGLLFMGPAGIGKTHLAVGILKELLKSKGADALFVDFQELLRKIVESYVPDSESTEYRLLEPVLNTELIILDDLGSKKATEWARDTIAYIINHRYNNNMMTIITTNYLDEDVSKTENNLLAERIGVRIRSRLYEMCERIVMKGDDFRSVTHHK